MRIGSKWICVRDYISNYNNAKIFTKGNQYIVIDIASPRFEHVVSTPKGINSVWIIDDRGKEVLMDYVLEKNHIANSTGKVYFKSINIMRKQKLDEIKGR